MGSITHSQRVREILGPSVTKVHFVAQFFLFKVVLFLLVFYRVNKKKIKKSTLDLPTINTDSYKTLKACHNVSVNV